MNVRLSASNKPLRAKLKIGGSKSESNRLLILKALLAQIQIENLSDSEDTKVLQRALDTSENVIDISHAGTAMRFLTAYFSMCPGKEILLTGSKRMQDRPIKILVNALNELGADISYQGKNGFPPLLIKGRKLKNYSVDLQANVSSQYISALMLMAPKLPNGLEIHLKNTPTSVPYLEMTRGLLAEIGVRCDFDQHRIKVFPAADLPQKTMMVEADWSSASYFFSIVALSDNTEIVLKNYKKDSYQGDSRISEIFENLGVSTDFENGNIRLKKCRNMLPERLEMDLSDTPDLAQTLIATCLGLAMPCVFTGLHTLKIKETDRLLALKMELEKFGAKVILTENSLQMEPADQLPNGINIETYDDHRMAMSFAPLALKIPLVIKHAEVVAKSYPNFWDDLKTLGFQIEKC